MADRISIGVGIQARISSRRFKNKVFAKLWNGLTVLESCIEQAKQLRTGLNMSGALCSLGLLVPKTQESFFKPYASEHQMWLITGPEHDVLRRYLSYQKEGGFDYIVRLTSDCPVFSPLLADQIIRKTLLTRSEFGIIKTPDPYPDGLDVEVIEKGLLKRIERFCQKNKAKSYKEHVTLCLKKDPILTHRRCELDFMVEFNGLPKMSIDTNDDLSRLQSLRGQVFWIH